MKKIILIVEDDTSLIRGLRHNLIYEGYEVMIATDGHTGFKAALDQHIDLILLDVMLPGLSGYDVCRRLREQRREIPIIMLTARGQEVDKIAGLDLGADDYITKPFSLPELLARIRAILRRTHSKAIEDRFSFADITLDFRKHEAWVNGERLELTTREFAIMKYFISRAGEVVHRHALLDEVWGYKVFPTTRTVDTHILELRKKLEKNPSQPEHLISVRGAGYKFVP